MTSVQSEVQKNTLEIGVISKLVESMQLLKSPRPKGVLDAFRHVMIYRKKEEWENHDRNVLFSAFKDLGYDEDEDFMLVLRTPFNSNTAFNSGFTAKPVA